MGEIFSLIFSNIVMSYFVAIVAIVATIISFLVINKTSSIYEKSLRKKYKKALNAKRLYEKENNDLEVKDKLEKKYNKAVKSLDRKLKMTLRFNKKQVNLPSDLYNSSEEFEFVRKSKKEIIVMEATLKERLESLAKNGKNKKTTAILEKKKNQKIQKQISKTNQTVKNKQTTASENISDLKFKPVERVLEKKDLGNTSSVSIYHSDDELIK